MQNIINTFTILGSILGIVAFFMTLFSSVYQYNIKKWEKISSVINFSDFEDFIKGASIGIMYGEPYNKFKHLIRLIHNNSDEIQFKGFLKKQISKQFIEILALSEKIHKEVQVPKWKLRNSGDLYDWIIDKEYIYRISKSLNEGDETINEAIDQMSETIEKIFTIYRKIHSLSNRLPYELLYKLK